MGGQGRIQSIHVRLLTLAARLVTMQACVVSALSAKPPLKPAWGWRSESGSGREGEGEGATYQRKTSVNAHPCKKKPPNVHAFSLSIFMPAPVWEDTRAPLIASILILSMCSRSSSSSTTPSFLAFFLRSFPVHST